MIKLTDRLQVLADQIRKQETMADIGTDHGFLPIYLWEQGISPNVILSDVSPGSLDKARVNVSQLQLPKENSPFDLRLGNGLQILSEGEVDAVVIAGMGGILMTEILGENLQKTRSFKRLILQPRSGQGKLRYWLVKNGFSITKELLVREGKYICEILTVDSSGNNLPISREIEGAGPDSIQYEVPPWILSAGDLAEEFILRKCAAEERVLSGLSKSQSRDLQKEKTVKERRDYLQSLLGGK